MAFLQEDKEGFAHFLGDFKSRSLIDAKTYDMFVGYLKHNREPEGPDLGAAKSYRTYILRCFSWDEKRGCVVFRSGSRKVMTKENIYDIATNMHLETNHAGADGLCQILSARYYGIPREAVRDLVRRCRKCFPRGSDDSPQRRARELPPLRETLAINGGGLDGQTEVDPSSHSDADSESLGNADHVESRLPWTSLEELRQWIEWLQHMKTRDWPQDLERSRYRNTISGLCTILETARPAGAYVETLGDSIYSAPYDSADLLCLTMQQATAELDKTEGPAKPIFVKHDITTVKGLRTINSYLHFMRDWLFTTMAVEKPSRRSNQTSGARWPLGKVIQRFGETGSESPPEELPPISVLDLGSIESDVVPECFGAEAMKSLRRHGTGYPWRSNQGLTSVEKWVLLAQRGSGTMTHQDHDGFWTWVMVEEGEKLWMICQLSEDDWKRFAEEGSEFTGGEWFYIWLKPGDVLIMPPGTVHAVFTPVDTLCVGGNARARKRVDISAMGTDESELVQPGIITAGGRSVSRLEDLIIKLSRQIESATSGGSHRTKNHNQTTPSTATAAAATTITTTATPLSIRKRPRSPQGPSPSAKRHASNNNSTPTRTKAQSLHSAKTSESPMKTRSLTSTGGKKINTGAAKTPVQGKNTKSSPTLARKSPASPITINTRRTTRYSGLKKAVDEEE